MESATMKCPTCGSEFPAGARFCPKCGYVVPTTAATPDPAVVVVEQPTTRTDVVYVDNPPAPTNWTPWIVGIVIALLAGTGYALWSGGRGMDDSTTVVMPAENDTVVETP